MGRHIGCRVIHIAAHDGDLLDDLGDTLQRQQKEARQQQSLARPDDQAAGAGGSLAGHEGHPDIGYEVEDHQKHEGHQKQAMAEKVDPVLHAPGQGTVDDIDADMFILSQRIGGGEHEGRAEQIPLRLQPGIRRDIEHLADDSVSGADQNRNQDEPGDRFTDDLRDMIYEPAEAEQCFHDFSPRGSFFPGSLCRAQPECRFEAVNQERKLVFQV